MNDAIPTECLHVAVESDSGDLILESGPVAPPRDGEVLIAVEAAGINRADLLQRRGLYPPPADASPILGLEVAGRVAAVGANCGDWRAGDRICALT
ncbi:MAG: alcohol dehydrogenase catalytic domain-containing protein, partial [Halioglobus sp.]|nr:alcohol dehydrogenase catalytic domain-containing protein [Halioglobus sp.]